MIFEAFLYLSLDSMRPISLSSLKLKSQDLYAR